MTAKQYVVRRVTARMVEAFRKGDLADAQNMNCFLKSLERMTPVEYAAADAEEISGAIS